MGKVLLVNSPIRIFAPPNNPPLGVMYLASALREDGHDVEICDLNAYRWMINDREYWLKKYFGDWDYIGLSGLIVTYEQQRWILDFILNHYEEFGNAILMSGGGLATSVPEFVKRHMPELDIIVRGEGEQTIREICSGKPISGIAGINYHFPMDQTWSDTADQRLIPDLDSIPYPAWDLVPMEEVYLGNPIWGGKAGNSSQIEFEALRSANMIISRGCPYNCNFCASCIMGRKYRKRSVANVIGEISELKRLYDIDFVGMVDDNTTFDRKWIREFCNELIKSGLGIKWGGSARVDALEPDILKLMKEAGCEFLGFGFESGSTEILEAMNKKADPQKAATAIKQTRAAGIHANGTFIVGYPGETLETLRETAKFMRDNDCLNSMFHIQPYPGTVLYDQIKDRIVEKYGTEDAYIQSLGDGTEFRINLTDIPDDELEGYRQKAMKGISF